MGCHDGGKILALLGLALLLLTNLRRSCPCTLRGCRRTLNARVHVCAVVVADIHDIVTTLHGARQRLQTNVVGATVAAEGNELDLLVSRDLACTLKALVGCLNARNSCARICKCIVNERNVPRVVGIDGSRHFQAARCRAAHNVVVIAAHEDLTHCHRCATTATQAMARSQVVGAGRKLLDVCHWMPLTLRCRDT